MSDKVLKDIASKLGVDARVLRKAIEFSQLLDVRAGSTTLAVLRLDGSSRYVVCVDLAAASCGAPVERGQSVRLSGLNKKGYINALKAVESMLGVQDRCTIRELAVQFGCTGATTLAQQSLDSYQSEYSKKCQETEDMDFTVPLFQTAALCAACSKLKIKIDKMKLQAVCSVKRATYNRLVVELEKRADALLNDKKVLKQKRTRNYIEEIEQKAHDADVSSNKQQKEQHQDAPAVNFDEWKRKILAQAAAAGKS